MRPALWGSLLVLALVIVGGLVSYVDAAVRGLCILELVHLILQGISYASSPNLAGQYAPTTIPARQGSWRTPLACASEP